VLRSWIAPRIFRLGTACLTFFLHHVQIQAGGVARKSEAPREGSVTAVALTFAEHRAEAPHEEENTMGILMLGITATLRCVALGLGACGPAASPGRSAPQLARMPVML